MGLATLESRSCQAFISSVMDSKGFVPRMVNITCLELNQLITIKHDDIQLHTLPILSRSMASTFYGLVHFYLYLVLLLMTRCDTISCTLVLLCSCTYL
ncbi:hypothetical protein M6B38_328975 [Iris pallida]|uniref:Uncharacterized protein n=1 Tax=Iris pallida TaxID=29817 RepID=A0AAX6H500_IRIPA|nr:hypothetical protein M6B38_328975 [Iris pallida]